MPSGNNGSQPRQNIAEITLVCTLVDGALVGMHLKNMPENYVTALGILEYAKGIVLEAFLRGMKQESLIARPDMMKMPPLKQ